VDRAKEVALLLEFVADQGIVLGRRYTTVEQRLAGVRWMHIMSVFQDPLQEAPVLKYAIKALKREQGASQPKMPVTYDMLEHLLARVDLRGLEHRTLWVGALMGFCFLLRSSEFLADARGGWDMAKVIRWEEICFRKGREVTVPGSGKGRPDEVEIHFRYSKGDQFGAGQRRNLFSTGQRQMCVVWQLWDLAVAWGGRRLQGPIMQWAPGEGIGQNQMALALREAAAGVGKSGQGVCVHSLGAGGATAMYDSGFS